MYVVRELLALNVSRLRSTGHGHLFLRLDGKGRNKKRALTAAV